jgi:hypothetical protein
MDSRNASVKEPRIMKKLLIAVFVCIMAFSGVFAGCGTRTPTATTPSTTVTPTPDDGFTAAWCREMLSSFKALRPADVPQNLGQTGSKMGGEFDVNRYFDVLTHISMDSGYVLDYVYITDTIRGGPILYVRPANKIPFYTYEDYRLATKDTPRQGQDNSLIFLVQGTDDTASGNKIQIDGTRQGYFEYAVLQTLSNQFYLLGSANYNDKKIICEQAELEGIWAEVEAAGLGPVAASVKETAGGLDFSPGVTFHPDIVQVTFVIFSKHTGFTRYSYYISKQYPYFVTTIKEDLLMNNNFTGK